MTYACVRGRVEFTKQVGNGAWRARSWIVDPRKSMRIIVGQKLDIDELLAADQCTNLAVSLRAGPSISLRNLGIQRFKIDLDNDGLGSPELNKSSFLARRSCCLYLA